MNEYINEHLLFNSTRLPSSVHNNMYTLHKISHNVVLACGEWSENCLEGESHTTLPHYSDFEAFEN